MKPRIGRRVYVPNSLFFIYAPKVYAIGKESFITDNFSSIEYPDEAELRFEDYNETWFTSLSKAKKILLNDWKEMYPNSKVKLVKCDEDYYELQGAEED